MTIGKVRYRNSLDLRSERKKLLRKKPINQLAVREKIEEFWISWQNRYAAVAEEDSRNERIITECAIAVGGKVVRRDTGKLSQETKYLIKKRQNMKFSDSTDRIEVAEISKLMNRRKVGNIRKYNMERIEHALKSGEGLRAVNRKLA